MSVIRKEVIDAEYKRALASIDYKIYNNGHKQYEFIKQTLLNDNPLTDDEKIEAIKKLNYIYDREKVKINMGVKRICENCNKECFATLYCECCVRNYLITKFSNWTSGNDNIDNLIQECQMKTFMPKMIIEWIPYSNLQNMKYLTKGGFSEIYTANWIDGRYEEWDSKEQQLIRFGTSEVILKRLENVENANQNWFEEVCGLNTKKVKVNKPGF
jgi:hypothetical protein